MRLFIHLPFYAFYVASIVLPLLEDIGVKSPLKNIGLDQQNNIELPGTDVHSGLAPLFVSKNSIQGKFIVVLNDGISDDDYSSHTAWIKEITGLVQEESVNEVKSFKNLNFAGYIGYFSEEVSLKIRENPAVKYVEQDGQFEFQETKAQENATWDLSRISSRKRVPGSSSYIHDPKGGEGVTAYLIDSGLKLDEDFEGRASHGKAISFPPTSEDLLGHGTHVGGIIGSKTWGVAKQVHIVSVQAPKGFKGSTINFSIAGYASSAVDDAVNAASNAGLHVVIGAGNNDDDACKTSPARASKPITVGAIDGKDVKASFSNFGECVDIYAPGYNIESDGLISSPFKMSGTSMATPHVTGLVSYFLSLQPGINSEFFSSLAEPSEVKKRILEFATNGTITNEFFSHTSASTPATYNHVFMTAQAIEDFEAFLEDNFEPTKFASSLLLATNVADDSELDLATPIKKLQFDANECESRMEQIARTHTEELVASFTKIESTKNVMESSVTPSVERVKKSYARIQREIVDPYKEASQLNEALQRIHTTSTLLRGASFLIMFIQQLQDCEAAGSDSVRMAKLYSLMSRFYKGRLLSNSPDFGDVFSLKFVKEYRTIFQARSTEFLSSLSEKISNDIAHHNSFKESNDSLRSNIMALHILDSAELFQVLDKGALSKSVQIASTQLSRALQSPRSFGAALEDTKRFASQFTTTLESLLRACVSEDHSLYTEFIEHLQASSLKTVYWERLVSKFKRNIATTMARGGPIAKSLVTNYPNMANAVKKIFDDETARLLLDAIVIIDNAPK
ncbi:hypothetical protein CA3LBN_002576 [Candidozyma haemuli]|uniref:Uncharacterized protein n=1 Tax=Candidozyma haemuli TaxID=45357 RepID=A0ABX8I4T7_9ASCO|nr:hypothetical protein CA3LBN_002576 [[Candida] haemuloni]